MLIYHITNLISFKRILFLSFTLCFSVKLPASQPSLQSLSKSMTWKKLLLFENGSSRVSNKNFFVSENGKFSLYEELVTSVEIIKSDKSNNFACRFPARFSFLNSRLNLNIKTSCGDFLTWKDSFEADGLSLIYASQFLGNPASAFGHTFLRIKSSSRTFYLNKVLSFSARVPEDTGSMEYIWKGLTGGFKGYFGLGPLYLKFHEYLQMEQRDLWEYDLRINEEQLSFFLSYLYELTNFADGDYFFISKNCSEMLVNILELNFQKEIASTLGSYVLPIETIKVLQKKDLITKVNYHPSLTSKLLQLANTVNNAKEREELKNIIEGSFIPNEHHSADILDFHIDRLNYLKQKQQGELTKKQRVSFMRALKFRSGVDTASKTPPPASFPPHLSSSPRRMSFGYGIRNKEQEFLNFEYRAGLHDLNDRINGYLKYSRIVFLNTKINYLQHDKKLILDELELLNLSKWVDFNIYTTDFSWGSGLKVLNSYLEKCFNCYHFDLKAFWGIGSNTKINHLLIYSTLNINLKTGNLDFNNQTLPAVEAGFIYSPNNFIFKTDIQYQLSIAKHMPLQKSLNLSSELNLLVSTNFTIGTSYQRNLMKNSQVLKSNLSLAF
ncbi:MAG: hypothetical protein CME70_13275 [Halobacteriovorax sp.]|nr:hypothetical protein [Halobacteriovorax sp.]|tara:strand:+ start:68626 stop:70455 length:1830 start_codon:yes stop_codon:yes gene_type:complete